MPVGRIVWAYLIYNENMQRNAKSFFFNMFGSSICYKLKVPQDMMETFEMGIIMNFVTALVQRISKLTSSAS